MKRLNTFAFCSIILLFTGCSLFTGSGKDDEKTKTVNITANGDVYLVKLNTSNSTVKAKNTGYVLKLRTIKKFVTSVEYI